MTSQERYKSGNSAKLTPLRIVTFCLEANFSVLKDEGVAIMNSQFFAVCRAFSIVAPSLSRPLRYVSDPIKRILSAIRDCLEDCCLWDSRSGWKCSVSTEFGSFLNLLDERR